MTLQGPRHIPHLCQHLDDDVLAYPSSLLSRSIPCIQFNVLNILTMVAQHLASDHRMAQRFVPKVCPHLHSYFAAMRNPLNRWQDNQQYDRFAFLICTILCTLPLEQMTCVDFTWKHTCNVFSAAGDAEEGVVCSQHEGSIQCIPIYWNMILGLLVADARAIGPDKSPQPGGNTAYHKAVSIHGTQKHHSAAETTYDALSSAIYCVAKLASCPGFSAAATQKTSPVVHILRSYLCHSNVHVALAAVEALHTILQTQGPISGVTDGLVSEVAPLLDIRSNCDLLSVRTMDLLLTQEPAPEFDREVFHSGALGSLVRSILSWQPLPMKYLVDATKMVTHFTSVNSWHVLPAMRLDLVSTLLMARRKARAAYAASAAGMQAGLGLQEVEHAVRDGMCMLEWLGRDLDCGRAAVLQADIRKGHHFGAADDFHWGALRGESLSGGEERAWGRWGWDNCNSLFHRMVHRAAGAYEGAEEEVVLLLCEEHEISRQAQLGRGGGKGGAGVREQEAVEGDREINVHAHRADREECGAVQQQCCPDEGGEWPLKRESLRTRFQSSDAVDAERAADGGWKHRGSTEACEGPRCGGAQAVVRGSEEGVAGGGEAGVTCGGENGN